MNRTPKHLRGAVAGLVVLSLAALGCDQDNPPAKETPAAPAAKSSSQAKRVPIGKSGTVFLEIDGTRRRVLVNATVCRREDFLEQLLCRKLTKEHESILTADADARDIHTALLAAG